MAPSQAAITADAESNQEPSSDGGQRLISLDDENAYASARGDREEREELRPKVRDPGVTLANLLILGQQELSSLIGVDIPEFRSL